jgi:hypothetical protein
MASNEGSFTAYRNTLAILRELRFALDFVFTSFSSMSFS